MSTIRCHDSQVSDPTTGSDVCIHIFTILVPTRPVFRKLWVVVKDGPIVSPKMCFVIVQFMHSPNDHFSPSVVCVTLTISFPGQYLIFSLQSRRHFWMWSTLFIKLNLDGQRPGFWISPKWHSLVCTQCEPLMKWYGCPVTQHPCEGPGPGAGEGLGFCAQVDPICTSVYVFVWLYKCKRKLHLLLYTVRTGVNALRVWTHACIWNYC